MLYQDYLQQIPCQNFTLRVLDGEIEKRLCMYITHAFTIYDYTDLIFVYLTICACPTIDQKTYQQSKESSFDSTVSRDCICTPFRTYPYLIRGSNIIGGQKIGRYE